MIYLKTPIEIEKIRLAARLWFQVVEALKPLIVINSTPIALANKANEIITKANGICAFKNYQGFPGYICVSVNEVCIHGIPNDKSFVKTDKVAVDIGVCLNNAICDAGFTKLVDDKNNQDHANLVYHTYYALMAGVSVAKAGNYTGDIACAICQYVKHNCSQYSILDDFCGHGCGIKLHEDPIVPNKGMSPKTGTLLQNKMVICIEPILTNQPSGNYFIDSHDKWSVRINEGFQSAHWECMIVINDDEPEILTPHQPPERWW